MKHNKINLRWCLVLTKTLTQINILHSKAPNHGVEEFLSIVNHNLTNHGHDYTIKLLKAYRLIIHQFALTQTVTPIKFRKAGSDGFPSKLILWKVDKDSTVMHKKYVLSIWRSIDVLRCEPEYKVDTIVCQTQPDLDLIDDITKFLKTWKGMKVLPSRPSQGYLVMSNKAGPNGSASVSCIDDLGPLKSSTMLYKSVKELLRISVPGLNPDNYKTTTSGKYHSKLVLLPDKACKTRVVAIADWWSNTALSGIHKSFMEGLRKLKGDVTFRQSSIPELIKGLGTDLYSADMTAFTDTFPRQLEKAVINTAWPGMGDLWEQVISNREFSHPKGSVKYATGNPMGLLSSWPVSSFTHHALKAWCAHVNGKTNYKYLVLGDDSMDTDIDVYNVYINAMSRLGVSASLSKCTQSKQGNTEFAKRLFYQGEEITGLPVDLLLELPNKPEQFIELVRIARERGYTDEELKPGVLNLVSKNKNSKILADILALPEPISGMRPLLDVKPGSWAEILSLLPEESQNSLTLIARESEFQDLVSELERAQTKVPHIGKRRVHIEENHPVLVGISDKLMLYLDQGEDEYSIYKEWMKGNFREMAHVPSIDSYRYLNKGHFVTRCSFRVFTKTLALANGNCNIPLSRFAPVSNWDLFQRGYPKE